jgi:hypothetical protein
MHMGMAAFNAWQQRDFVLIVMGLTVFYFFSRRYENQADKTAVRTTGDPEAQIIGLLKISGLNLTPVRFGKASERWLTHPSTLRRVERIAAAGGLPPERLREILDLYTAAESRGEAAFATGADQQDHYVVPGANDREKLRSAVAESGMVQVRLWVLRVAHVVPAALVWMLIEKSQLLHTKLATWIAGIIISILVVLATGMWLGTARQKRNKRRLQERFTREGVPAGGPGDMFVGLAPSKYPRFFTNAYYSDNGFLVLAQERLVFVGQKTRFCLAPEEIEEIALGPGYPSWWNVKSIYIRWKQAATAQSHILHLYFLEPRSMWRRQVPVRELCRRLQSWRVHPEPERILPQEFAALQGPTCAEVTCISPRELGGVRIQFKLLSSVLLLGAGVSILLRADFFYICGVAIAVRLFESLPYWLYRDKSAFTTPPMVNVPSAEIRTAIPVNSDAG